jgi:hypothetical protein
MLANLIFQISPIALAKGVQQWSHGLQGLDYSLRSVLLTQFFWMDKGSRT